MPLPDGTVPDRTALLDRLAGIGLLSLDVDGVQTDGGLYYSETGAELRRFHVHDGQGIKAVMAAGVAVAFVTASTTPAIGHRAARLGVRHAFLGVPDKEAALKGLCAELDLGLDRVAHVGDDVNDLGLLRLVGCPLTVANARPEVREACLYITGTAGGAGAVREICDLIVTAKTQTTRRPV